jgi:hypothetical protein
MVNTRTARGLVYTTGTFQKRQAENKNVTELPEPEKTKRQVLVTNLG